MKKSEKTRAIAVSLCISAVICLASMCFFVGGNVNYADAENTYLRGAISANAEISEPPYSLKKMEFDDSVWGRLAALMQDMLEAWRR